MPALPGQARMPTLPGKSASKTATINFVFFHFVSKNSFRRIEQSRGARPIAARGLQRVLNQILLESADGLSLFIASARVGTFGGNDIWAADRASLSSPWGEPRNLGAPINTSSADFCPPPVLGREGFDAALADDRPLADHYYNEYPHGALLLFRLPLIGAPAGPTRLVGPPTPTGPTMPIRPPMRGRIGCCSSACRSVPPSGRRSRSRPS